VWEKERRNEGEEEEGGKVGEGEGGIKWWVRTDGGIGGDVGLQPFLGVIIGAGLDKSRAMKIAPACLFFDVLPQYLADVSNYTFQD